MARIVKEQEYLQKRNAILDVVYRLVLTKGYEQMAIQDILDELRISRGAFYHYFDSKQALLAALIERILDEVEQLLVPIVQDTHRNALEKLQGFLNTLIQWKTKQKTFVFAIMRVWYADDNSLVRQRLHVTRVQRLTPLLGTIFRQGCEEGSMATFYPEQIGMVVLTLVEDLADTIARKMLSESHDSDYERVVATYTDALERVLGVASGSLQVINAQQLKEWIAPQQTSL